VGDRVAVTDVPRANAELMTVPATHAIPLPAEVSFELAAASLLQGLTAHYLVTDSHRVIEGETVLVHAASGGVGQFLTQFAVLHGARAIGLTTRDAKKRLILSRGASAAWNVKEPWVQQTLDFTYGRGVDVVYDSVGSTLDDSFAVTRVGGAVVLYGTSGKKVPPVDVRMLMDSSKTLTGGDLWGYLTSREERVRRSRELFGLLLSRRLVVSDPVLFPLAEGRRAHDYLEGGHSAGKVVLTVAP
jgi:NADPH2:quinone reductase